MSESEGGGGAGRREVAYRMFAAEFEDADYSYSERDEDRAPNYVITPSGARANRLFVVGVLTEVEQVSEESLRGRVVDPTGGFVLYAGQYQPDEQAFLEATETPTFVAVTGKARTFVPDDSEQVYTSLRPESISEVDPETRDQWTVQAVEQTLRRVGWMATALELDTPDVRELLVERGAEDGLAHGIELALSHYGTTPTYLDSLREMALDAARVVAGEKSEIDVESRSPDASGAITVGELKASLPETPSVSRAEPDLSGSDGDESPSEAVEAVPAESSDTGGREDAETSTATEPSAQESESSEQQDAEAAEEQITTPESQVAESDMGSIDEEESAQDEGSASEAEAAEDLGDFEPEEFELEAETREEIESEYGTEFQSGSDVDEPGNADIETPDQPIEPEETSTADEPAADEMAGEAESEPTSEETVTESAEVDTETEETATESAEADSGDPDESEALSDPEEIEETVVELLGELDSGDGVEEETLLAEMSERYGTDGGAVEDAIESALMAGKCYEPADDVYKPI